jgi:hypothetical protein
MVSFEDMVAGLKLQDKLLAFIKSMHKTLHSSTGINMDHFQKWVFVNMPKYTFTNGLIFCAISVLIWGAVFMITHWFVGAVN